jgi:tripartite-type tricarboxylate transporter receptor subunit TctC
MLAASATSAAAAFPEKPISIVVPFTAAGPSDAVGRLLAKSFTDSLGQKVNVENIAGGGGSTGSARVAKAPGDGYTLLLHHFAHAASAALYPKLPYDPAKDFEPIGLVSYGPYVLSARTSLPIKDVKSAFKYIRDNKTKTNFGHAGVGSGSHLANLLLSSSLGKVKFTEKTYRGTGPAMTDLAAGQIDFLFDQSVSVMPNVAKGTIRPLAVTSATRLPNLKDVPTMQEAGLKGFEVTQWFALYAPKGTPKPVIDRLSAALETALAEEITITTFEKFGTLAFPAGKRGPADAKKKLGAEIVRWRKIIKEAGVKVE